MKIQFYAPDGKEMFQLESDGFSHLGWANTFYKGKACDPDIQITTSLPMIAEHQLHHDPWFQKSDAHKTLRIFSWSGEVIREIQDVCIITHWVELCQFYTHSDVEISTNLPFVLQEEKPSE